MSSDESDDLLLAIDFWGQRSPTSSAKSQTRRRIENTFDVATAGREVYKTFSRRSKVSSASKVASFSSPSPEKKFVPTAAIVRRKRKIPRKGPIIFSDSDSSEDEESKHIRLPTNKACKTSTTTNASIIEVEQHDQFEAREVPETSFFKHTKIPRETSRETESNILDSKILSLNKRAQNVTGIEKLSPSKDEISQRDVKSFEAKLSECQSDTKHNSGSEVASSWNRINKNHDKTANCKTVSTSSISHEGTVADKGSIPENPTKQSAITVTSGVSLCTNRSPLMKTSTDDSAEELDSLQMEQSFYTCDKLKISRSRFGAFRRKNYKFAPLIFSDDNERRSKFYKPTVKRNGETFKTRVTVGTTKAISVHKNQDEVGENSSIAVDMKKAVSSAPNTETTGAVDETVNFEQSAEYTVDMLEILKNPIHNRPRRGNDVEHRRVCYGNSRISNFKLSAGSDLSSYSGGNNDLSSGKTIGNHRNLKSLSNSQKKSEISDVSKTESNKTDSDAVNSVENCNQKSPQKRKAFFAMNEIFFGEEIDKIKPAPSKKRTFNNVPDPDKAKNESNETTLLDDDSLWSSPKKSSCL